MVLSPSSFVGIYWNNHHHMLHAAEHISGAESVLAKAIGRGFDNAHSHRRLSLRPRPFRGLCARSYYSR